MYRLWTSSVHAGGTRRDTSDTVSLPPSPLPPVNVIDAPCCQRSRRAG